MYRLMLLTVLVLLLPACEEPTPPLGPDAYLRAVVEDAVTIEHRGGAEYYGGTRSDTHRKREISSYDGEADARLWLQILNSAPSVWEAGVFPLTPRNFDGGDNDGNTALYLMPGSELYVAESGTLRITEVTEDRVIGEFEFTAVYWCTPPVNREQCYTLPETFPTSASRIDVTGTFSAEGSRPVPRL